MRVVVIFAGVLCGAACAAGSLPADSTCDFDVVVDAELYLGDDCQLDPGFTDGPVQIVAGGTDGNTGGRVIVFHTIGEVRDVTGDSVARFSADGSAAVLLFSSNAAYPRDVLISTAVGKVSCTFDRVITPNNPGCMQLEPEG